MEFITIKQNNADKFINLNLKNGFGLTDYSEGLNNFINSETEKHINPIIDKELIRLLPANDFNLIPYFLKGVYSNSFINAGFRDDELSHPTEAIINSFFIFEYFDSKNESNQNKLSINIIKSDDKGCYYFNNNMITPKLKFKNEKLINEFNVIYLPKYKLQENSFEKIYMKISFFNSKTGKRRYFTFNNLTSEDKFYLEIILNKQTKKYSVNGVDINMNEFIDEYNENLESNDGDYKLNFKTVDEGKKLILSDGRMV